MSDLEFYHQSRLLLALAFVPPDAIHAIFTVVSTMIRIPELRPLVSWFQLTYLGIPEDRARNVRERRARYPPVEWKLFQRTLDQHSRSNNFNESNNKKLMKIVGTPHPHLWDFMLRVKTAYLSDYDNDFNDWVHGRGHRHRKRQAINRDTRIRNQVHRYQQFLAGRLTAEEYLNGMVVALRG
uniref:MULE transposase domain-containing protein n=1 Tax=Ditylenchus dipsaci TaxID=166011 RepID=A0A915DGV7_9BILA